MLYHHFIRLLTCSFVVLFLFTGCGTKYKVSDNPPPITLHIPEKKIHLALVLGGGGARGLAHVGVLEEFEQAGISIDMLVGCSAGSIVGALYAEYQNAQKVRCLLEPLKKWDILDINLWYCRYGLVQGRSLGKFLETKMTCSRFEELKVPLYIVSTDLLAGELVTFSRGPLIPAVHASVAVPFVFAPVLYQGRLLVDGGVADPIPVGVAQEVGADIIVAVDLSELLPKSHPTNLFGIARRSAEIKFLLQSESCCKAADVVISPEQGDVGMFDDKNNELMYQAGRKAAKAAIPRILELLEERKQACESPV